jgi:hypothetical protein
MTTNQIIIPVAGVLLAGWFFYLALRTRRLKAANAHRDHRANAPDTGHNKGAIARSAAHGLGGQGR